MKPCPYCGDAMTREVNLVEEPVITTACQIGRGLKRLAAFWSCWRCGHCELAS